MYLSLNVKARLRPWRIFGLSLGFKRDIEWSTKFPVPGITDGHVVYDLGPVDVTLHVQGKDVLAQFDVYGLPAGSFVVARGDHETILLDYQGVVIRGSLDLTSSPKEPGSITSWRAA